MPVCSSCFIYIINKSYVCKVLCMGVTACLCFTDTKTETHVTSSTPSKVTAYEG